jgi:hypothetical protein
MPNTDPDTLPKDMLPKRTIGCGGDSILIREWRIANLRASQEAKILSIRCARSRALSASAA